jgi:hypothetical protein
MAVVKSGSVAALPIGLRQAELRPIQGVEFVKCRVVDVLAVCPGDLDDGRVARFDGVERHLRRRPSVCAVSDIGTKAHVRL